MKHKKMCKVNKCQSEQDNANLLKIDDYIGWIIKQVRLQSDKMLA